MKKRSLIFEQLLLEAKKEWENTEDATAVKKAVLDNDVYLVVYTCFGPDYPPAYTFLLNENVWKDPDSEMEVPNVRRYDQMTADQRAVVQDLQDRYDRNMEAFDCDEAVDSSLDYAIGYRDALTRISKQLPDEQSDLALAIWQKVKAANAWIDLLYKVYDL